MRTKFLLSLAALMASSASFADINVSIPEDCNLKTLQYYYAPLKQYAQAKSRSERGIVADSVSFNNSKAVIPVGNSSDGYMYVLNFPEENVTLFVNSGDNVNVNVSGCQPLSYSLSGSNLADGLNDLNAMELPLMAKAKELQAKGDGSSEEMQQLGEQYDAAQKEFFNTHKNEEVSLLALMNLNGEDFISAYESVPAALQSSILFPLVEKQYESEKKNLEMEKKQQALQSGEVTAPSFTLKDLEGKDVSLSDFRGKWVILDFWGSWCPWCIKGFPELKEAYQKYGDELEIIGIDCRESEAEWKAGVEKYQLPWVNVYNPDGSPLLSEYGVQGFPTKAIIDPEGKIRNITVGHDPAFYTALTQLMGK